MYQKVLKWIFQYVILPWILAQIPPRPTDWNDSGQVRQFILACLNHQTIVWIIQTTDNEVDNEAVSFAKEILEQKNLWETARNILSGEHKTLWQTIKEWFAAKRTAHEPGA